MTILLSSQNQKFNAHQPDVYKGCTTSLGRSMWVDHVYTYEFCDGRREESQTVSYDVQNIRQWWDSCVFAWLNDGNVHDHFHIIIHLQPDTGPELSEHFWDLLDWEHLTVRYGYMENVRAFWDALQRMRTPLINIDVIDRTN